MKFLTTPIMGATIKFPSLPPGIRILVENGSVILYSAIALSFNTQLNVGRKSLLKNLPSFISIS
ncbi:MAG: hypothetical protein R2744_11740 [Bacteroidales bacterium]